MRGASSWQRRRASRRRGTRAGFHKSKSSSSGSNTLKYDRGYKTGYAQGVQYGRQDYAKPFEGTSIIIPTYNGLGLLLPCLDSIQTHTSLPYEIIVVDNGSTDGTVEALRRRGPGIRLRELGENKGFAQAVNIGLMMCKGTTIVILNNDTLMPEGWLGNLQACLSSQQGHAVIGPVTNYIGGEQQIDVPYQDVTEMWDFASAYNRSHGGRWRSTDRLAGFCLMFTREVLERTGFFDEGYQIGNFEDDDFMIRLRMLGIPLVIAENTFVHHTGSATMRTLGREGYLQVNGRNEQFFLTKWGDRRELRHSEGPNPEPHLLKSVDLYPSRVLVHDLKNRIYWLEQGVKHPIPEPGMTLEELPHRIRLSMLELRQYRTGRPIDKEELQGLLVNQGADAEEFTGALFEGGDARRFRIEHGMRREILTHYAAECWGLAGLTVKPLPEELNRLPEGLPIIPPPLLLSAEL